MKKVVSLVLALIMCIFVFASCSKNDLQFGKEYRELSSQMDVLLQLNAGSIDVGVMDSIMAGYYMSKDTTYYNTDVACKAEGFMLGKGEVTDVTQRRGGNDG